MKTLCNVIIILLATSLAQALPQAEPHQRDVSTALPVITFADYAKGSWNDWDYMKKDDLEKDLRPRISTIPLLNVLYLYEAGGKYSYYCQTNSTASQCSHNLALDDNGKPFLQSPVLWKANIPKGKNCDFGIEGTTTPQTLEGSNVEYNLTDRFMFGYVVKEVSCYLPITTTNTSLSAPTPVA